MFNGNFCILSPSDMEAQFVEKGKGYHSNTFLHGGIQKGHEREGEKILVGFEL